MGNWTIRRARIEDAESLSQCVAVAYEHYIERMDEPPGPMLTDYASEIEQRQVWVAELNGETIGGLVLQAWPDYLHLDNIAVHPDYQGRGLGKALLGLADAEALSQGYAELRLYTHVTMTENIALYPRLGWQETHRANQHGYDRVFFRKRLSHSS